MQRSQILLRRAVAQARPNRVSTRLPAFLKPYTPRTTQAFQPRFQHQSIFSLRYSSSATNPSPPLQPLKTSETEPEDRQTPSYFLTFTCKPCGTRSQHRVTKQGYHHGTVLVKCPGCQSRHVISDHLKIFMDEASTLEDILKRTAGTDKDISKMLKKGRLGQRPGELVGNEWEQDLEFWDDGTVTKHTPSAEDKTS